MILVDYNQLVIAASAMVAKTPTSTDETGHSPLALTRHLVWNMLRTYRRKFFGQYGELVICCDRGPYWREDVFPYYKHNRKTSQRIESPERTAILDHLSTLRTELTEFSPYKVVTVIGAEADDVIATLVRAHPFLPSVIVSDDHDFGQLQTEVFLTQYQPRKKSFFQSQNPALLLRQHIVEGDPGDGVPNFLSDDDSLAVNGKKQRPLRNSAQYLDLNASADSICTTPEMRHGWQRNQRLVDFDFIPDSIREKCLNAYAVAEQAPRSELLDYFMRHRCKALMAAVGEF